MPEPLTLHSATLSSDEEDEDYVPDEQDSDSDGETKRETKKQRVEKPAPAPVNPMDNETTRSALWESFLESTTTSASGSGQATPAPEPKIITIERRHRFAGEDVIEKVQVAEDSAEAVDWKKRQSTVPSEQTSAATGSSPPAAPASNTTSTVTQLNRPPSTDPIKGAPTPTSAKPQAAAKPRRSLSSLAAASKPKKLTTLEKSRLDWQSHLATVTPDERDELERNKQAGGTGYLEKVDFLARVGERRENVFEDSKRKRR